MLRGLLDKIDRKDWRNAVIGGVLIGLLPVVGIGASLLHRGILDETSAAWMFGFVLLLAGALFGVTGAAITLYFSVFIRQWPHATRHLIGEYDKFAGEIGGELFLEHPPGLFRFLGPWPRRVLFQHEGRETVLEIVEEPAGEDKVVYTCLAFPISGAVGFSCQIYPSGMLSRIGELFGFQDVRVGSPEFDERFVVKASNEFRASEVLSGQVQIGLLELATWAETVHDRSVIDVRHVELRIESKTMSVHLLGFLDSAEKLLTYTEHGKRLWNDLQMNLSKHR